MRPLGLFIVAMCIVAAPALTQTETPPKDQIECIDQIKAWKMSENARQSISTIAGIRLGVTILGFNKDETSGAYFKSYTGTKCYSPDRNPEDVKLEREQYKYQVEEEILELRPLADFDGSGFVGTDEGSRFRNLIEFGYWASHVIEGEEGDIDRVCKGLMMSRETFDENLGDYKELRIKAKELGIEDLPELDLD